MRYCPVSFESARLRFRVPKPDDGAEVNAAVAETFESLNRWMPWAAQLPSVEDTEEFVRTSAAAFIQRVELNYLLFRKEDASFVGGCGLHHIDWSIPKFEIGYWCRARYQGRGYISEAVRATAGLVFGVLGGKRLELRNALLANDGSLRTTLVYGMVPEEYERLAADWSAGRAL